MKKVNVYSILLCTLLLAISINSKAQQSLEVTLEDAIQHAYQHNLSIRNAQLAVSDATERVYETRSFGLPQVNGELSFQHYPKVPVQALPDEFVNLARDPMTGELPPGYSREVSFLLKNTFTAGISLSSLVFDGSYLVGLQAARLYQKYARKELDVKKAETRNNVMDAYLPALLIDESIRLIEKNEKLVGSILSDTKAFYKEGFVEQLDVDRLELSLANLTVEKNNLKRQREMAMNALKYIIAYPQDQELILVDDINTLLIEATGEEISGNINFNNRPEYELIAMGIQLNEMNIKRFQAGYLPSLGVFANYQQSYNGDNFKDGFWAPTFVIGAQLNIPIFDGFDKRSKIQRRKIDLETAKNQQGILIGAITVEVNNARIAYGNAKNRVADQEKNIELADRIYNTTLIKFKEGVGSSMELHQAEQSLYQTQSNYTQALYDLVQAKINLNKALGTVKK